MTPAELSQFPLWNADPVLLRAGGLAVRWYSVCFLLVFVLGYPLWHWQMRRGGHAPEPTSRIVLWAVAGVIAGGRLGHCLFYEPDFYLAHPLAILDLRRGGVASHGSALGLALCIFLYARHYGYSMLELGDRFSFPAMLGAALVRIGNFFNSEIVGREWTGPLALRFERFAARSQALWEREHGPLGWVAQPLPRHPAQLYEAAGCLAVLALLLVLDRRWGERRPRGFLMGLFMAAYFSFRFGIEQVKEFQRFGALAPDAALRVIRIEPTAGLTMGQWLSVPFVLLFLGVAVAAWRRRLAAARLAPCDASPEAP